MSFSTSNNTNKYQNPRDSQTQLRVDKTGNKNDQDSNSFSDNLMQSSITSNADYEKGRCAPNETQRFA